jgi:hypothetical protein
VKGTQVSSDKNLLRRGFGPPDKRFENPDGSATSRVFKLRQKDKGKLSVDVKELTTIEKAVIDKSKFLLFEISVLSVNNIGLSAIHEPSTLEEDGIENSAHAAILGLDEDDDIKPGLLARASKRLRF